MDAISYKTLNVNKANSGKKWVIVDANEAILGRFSSKVAKILRGKHKPSYTPNTDCGDNVIIINADKVKLTGKKLTDKRYVSYSGYPGGQKLTSPSELLSKFPNRLVEKSVRGMLPKTKLGRELFRNLFVYAGDQHPHEAQQPVKIEL